MLEVSLFLVAVVALGRATFLLVTALAGITVSSFFVNFDFSRRALVAGCTVHLFAMGFVLESNRTFLAIISYGVGSVGQSEGESDQHYSNHQFLHDSLLVVNVR